MLFSSAWPTQSAPGYDTPPPPREHNVHIFLFRVSLCLSFTCRLIAGCFELDCSDNHGLEYGVRLSGECNYSPVSIMGSEVGLGLYTSDSMACFPV